ncbi:hypothetical protein GF420_10545 [candidate division GN15 bacterium]|nr:hypothetical protein [candidate division GN15 bacterium]
MVIWLYILILIIALLALLSLLRLRFRLMLDEHRQLVFVGLGRSGSELNFKTKRGTLKVAGITIKRFGLDQEKKPKAPGKKPEPETKEKKEEPSRKWWERDLSFIWRESKSYLRMVWEDIRGRGDAISHAIVRYGIDLLRSLILEQLEADVEAGFDEPHVTGEAYGYYQAAAAALPGVIGRINFLPVWTGAYFRGAVRLSIALPLYALVWRTVVLLWRLPITRLVKLAIQKKKGAGDVK